MGWLSCCVWFGGVVYLTSLGVWLVLLTIAAINSRGQSWLSEVDDG